MEDEGRPLLLDISSNQMQPLPWDPRRAKISGIFIQVSVALERLAYYAVVMNLFLYLNRGNPEVYLQLNFSIKPLTVPILLYRKRHGSP